MADELPIPIEIPWQLASTTQPLVAGQPSDTAITLFTFEPDQEATAAEFPGQRLIFLKATLTISPAAFPPGTAPVAASMLGEGVPCYHAQLDLIVRREGGGPGTIRPYFHAAAPFRREMLQTGVIGGESFEGTADHQAMGRSASQIYETSQSHSSTASISAGGSFLGFGASASLTDASVAGRRSVDQVSDTTTRDASQERRELISHMTRVENVLTLLNAKYVGTPYLRFSMSPRPLEQLSIDSSDPSLWFGQLLQRRSSGIEGIQEFTAVVLVPKGEDFCVTARLRRVCVFDDPPVEPNFQELFNFSRHLGRVLNYVDRTYPVGTPIDDLDVDIRHGTTGALGPQARPVIETWVIGADGRLIADVVATNGNPVQVQGLLRGSANYKTFVELWLETMRDEYERDCARSPLERGVLLGETLSLDTCFNSSAPGPITVLSSTVGITPLRPSRLGVREFGLAGPPTAAASAARPVRAKALETVTRWNSLSAELKRLLDNPADPIGKDPGKFNDNRLIDILINRWAKLETGDPRNLSLADLGPALGLNRTYISLLKSAGISDLSGLALALNAAPVVERHGASAGRSSDPSRQPVQPPLNRQQASEIKKLVGEKLLAPLDERPER